MDDKDNNVLEFHEEQDGGIFESGLGLNSLDKETQEAPLFSTIKKLGMAEGFGKAKKEQLEAYLKDHTAGYEQALTDKDGNKYINAQIRPDSNPIVAKIQVPSADGIYYMSFMGYVSGDAQPGEPDAVSLYPESAANGVKYWKALVRSLGTRKCSHAECGEEHGFVEMIFLSTKGDKNRAELQSDEACKFIQEQIDQLMPKQ